MRARWPVIAVFMGLGEAYFGYPYATLYRLEIAVRLTDAATLSSTVNWYAVREGFKEDICDMVLDAPATTRPSNELAPFGFVRGTAGNPLKRAVTPEILMAMTRVAVASTRADAAMVAPPTGTMKAHVEWAFSDDPTRFRSTCAPTPPPNRSGW